MAELCSGLSLDIALLRPAENDSASKTREEIAMKLVVLSNSANHLIEAILQEGNLAMEWVPESYGDFKDANLRRIIGSEEQIRTLKLVSGWRYDYAECKRLGDHALVTDLDLERLSAIVQRAFPGIEIGPLDSARQDELDAEFNYQSRRNYFVEMHLYQHLYQNIVSEFEAYFLEGKTMK